MSLTIRCSEHDYYKAVYPPTADCEFCKQLYRIVDVRAKKLTTEDLQVLMHNSIARQMRDQRLYQEGQVHE